MYTNTDELWQDLKNKYTALGRNWYRGLSEDKKGALCKLGGSNAIISSMVFFTEDYDFDLFHTMAEARQALSACVDNISVEIHPTSKLATARSIRNAAEHMTKEISSALDEMQTRLGFDKRTKTALTNTLNEAQVVPYYERINAIIVKYRRNFFKYFCCGVRMEMESRGE